MSNGSNLKKYFIGSLFWGVASKIVNSIVNFITIPILLVYLGADNYGLLTLAIATNAYIHILDLGINTGSIKFISNWLQNKQYVKIERVTRTNISLYLLIGFINSIILLGITIFGRDLFNVTSDQYDILQRLFIILSITSIFSWLSSVFSQLIIADSRINFIQKVQLTISILRIVLVFIAASAELDIILYFAIYILLSAGIVVPYYIYCKKNQLVRSIIPSFYFKEFKEVILYSLAIFAIGIFQTTATLSRPIIIGIFGQNSADVITEYRIIEVFPLFAISIGGILMSALLPKASQAICNNDKKFINKLSYEGTRSMSILVSFICFPIIISSSDILLLYVGPNYTHLSVWLDLWLLTVILFLHNAPIASLVLATGKTKILMYSTAIACIISILLNAILADSIGVGSAVVGYFVYIVVMISVYYMYFNNKVLKVDSLKIFKYFFYPFVLGLFSLYGGKFIYLSTDNTILNIAINTLIWGILYCFSLILFRLVSMKQIRELVFKSY